MLRVTSRFRGLGNWSISDSDSGILGVLFLSGALAGIASLLLPNEIEHSLLMWVVSAIAACAGLALVGFAKHTTYRAIVLATALGSLLINVAVLSTGSASNIYSGLFVWVALIGAHFFSRRMLALQVAWMLLGYGVVLNLTESPDFAPVARLVISTVVLVSSAMVVMWLVEQRRRAESRAQNFFDLSIDPLTTVDAQTGIFIEVNEAWERVLGYPRSELIGRRFIDFVHPDDREETERVAESLPSKGEADELENRYRAADGTWRWLNWRSTYAEDEDLVYARATDVTERHQMIDRISSQAKTDALTGLPNRRWLDDELTRLIARAQRHGHPVCVALVDIDHFKSFNDTHGHAAGDKLLRDCAEAWREAIRATDFLARCGGEEFVIALPDSNIDQAAVAAEKMKDATPSPATCSIGIAQYRENESIEGLLHRADLAMYKAKAAGRDLVAVDGDELSDRASFGA